MSHGTRLALSGNLPTCYRVAVPYQAAYKAVEDDDHPPRQPGADGRETGGPGLLPEKGRPGRGGRRSRSDRADCTGGTPAERPHAAGPIRHLARGRGADSGRLDRSRQGHGLFREHRDPRLCHCLWLRVLHRGPVRRTIHLLPARPRQRIGSAGAVAEPEAARRARRARRPFACRGHPAASRVRVHVLRLGLHRAGAAAGRTDGGEPLPPRVLRRAVSQDRPDPVHEVLPGAMPLRGHRRARPPGRDALRHGRLRRDVGAVRSASPHAGSGDRGRECGRAGSDPDRSGQLHGLVQDERRQRRAPGAVFRVHAGMPDRHRRSRGRSDPSRRSEPQDGAGAGRVIEGS